MKKQKKKNNKKNIEIIKNGTITQNEQTLHDIGHILISLKKPID